MKYIVDLIWSSESDSWYTMSNDVPGLALGAETFDALVGRVRMAVPELLELNLGYKGDIEICFRTERLEVLAAVS
jgi:hypothetical protein